MIPLKHCEMSHHFSRAHCSYIKKKAVVGFLIWTKEWKVYFYKQEKKAIFLTKKKKRKKKQKQKQK